MSNGPNGKDPCEEEEDAVALTVTVLFVSDDSTRIKSEQSHSNEDLRAVEKGGGVVDQFANKIIYVWLLHLEGPTAENIRCEAAEGGRRLAASGLSGPGDAAAARSQ